MKDGHRTSSSPQDKNHSKTADLPAPSPGAPAKQGLAGGIIHFLPFNPAARVYFLSQRGSHLNQGPHHRAQSAPRRPSVAELWPWDGAGPAVAAGGVVLACDVTWGRRAAATAGHTAPTCVFPKSRKQDKGETGKMWRGHGCAVGPWETFWLLCTVVSTCPLYSQECGKAGPGRQGATGLPSSAGSRGPQTIAPGPPSPLASTLRAWVRHLPPSLPPVP